MSGLTQVRLKERSFHCLKRFRAFRRVEGLSILDDEIRCSSVTMSAPGCSETRCSHTGDNGGDVIVGICSNVDTAGAPVSPLISAPSPLDFLLGRGILSLDRGLVLDFVELRGDNSGNVSTLEDIEIGVGVLPALSSSVLDARPQMPK